MQCPQCQYEKPRGMKFCGQCAAPLVATCPSCGAANPPENEFCGQWSPAARPPETLQIGRVSRIGVADLS
jgi:hypothetical protein